ncbi:response regulator transcription factor [Streptomyces sp. NPDC005728]|uniref:response regulator transcription factor n=1 Tax=Streptomyces sp. NPDC005728 TaxID=3157054 RepID=UPI0033FEE219
MISVLLVDDEQLVRQGIRLVLESAGDISVVGEVSDGFGVVYAVRRHRPDVVIMDIHMPGLDGLEVIGMLTGIPNRPRIVMLTAHALDEYLYRSLNAGADGFLVKDISPHELIAGVRSIAEGDALVSPSMTRRLIESYTTSAGARGNEARNTVDGLPADQRYLLMLIAHGMSNAEIGRIRRESESRVKAHVSFLLRTLGLSNRVQAATLACTAGLLDQPLPAPPP